MANDYISKEKAIESLNKIRSYIKGPNTEYATMMFWEVEDFIDTLPAADVRPVVRGRWIKYAPYNSDMMTCSECEKYWILDGNQYDYNFCPNCGADMREDGTDG